MLSPSARNTYRIAMLVMRTHAVPIEASAHGSTSRVTTISASPPHASFGFLFVSKKLRMKFPECPYLARGRRGKRADRVGHVPAQASHGPAVGGRERVIAAVGHVLAHGRPAARRCPVLRAAYAPERVDERRAAGNGLETLDLDG